MKAAIVDAYGPPDVVRVGDMPIPEPDADEILVQVYAASVTTADWRMRSATFPPGMGILARLALGIFKPRRKVLGNDCSGVVVKTGANVSKFKVGDRVIAQADGNVHAEYMTVKQTGSIAPMPAGLTFEQAGAMGFGGTTALHFLGKAEIKPGEKLLINGASGSVGTAMIAIGKHMGAEVTAVCSGVNAELVRDLGADHVIDYTATDFTSGHAHFDVIADTVGTAPYAKAKAVLNRGGRFLVILGDAWSLLGLIRADKNSGHQVIGGVAEENGATSEELARLAEEGVFIPVIDEIFPLEQVAAAHRRVETGRKRGNVVLTMPIMGEPEFDGSVAT